MTNQWKRVLYVGVTSDIAKRVYQHKTGWDPKSFTSRYKLTELVYVEIFPTISDAIDFEKKLKGGSRQKKRELVMTMNPEWRDLSDDIY